MHFVRHALSQAQDRGVQITARIAVIGIGHSLRGDDAAGLEAVRAWQAEHPTEALRPELKVECAEVPGLALLEILEGMEAAVIVDAIESGSPAGTIHEVGAEAFESFEQGSKSAHGWGVAESLRLGRMLDPLVAKVDIHVIGIEASQYEVGAELSREVRAAIPRASAIIQEQVTSLLKA